MMPSTKYCRLSLLSQALTLSGWLLWSGCSIAISASETTPIIRVDPGAHSAPATGIRYFNQGENIVTASLDKTIRIWRSRDFKLLRTLRIPIDNGLEGRLYFVDVNPTGTLLVAGGHTCYGWEKTACLYVFNPTTGRLLKRISGLQGTIANLKFSPDGKTLAVGMTQGGMVFLDGNDFSVVGKDSDFGSAVSGMDISADGFTAVSSLDGYLRIYDASYKLVARQKLPDLKMIGSTFFSPDGSKLLLGSFETSRFEILSFPELKRVGFTDVKSQASKQQTLRNAFWSSSGDYIFAAGDSLDLQKSVIYRWQSNNLSAPQQFSIPTHRLAGMRAFTDDKLLFSTEDGFVGAADKNGRIIATSQHAIIQFPLNSRSFQTSEDGSVVAFPSSQDDLRPIIFDTRVPGVVETLGESLPKMYSSQKESRNFKLTDWENSNKPILNGHALEMINAFEVARSYAIAPKDDALLLGTDAALRAYNKQGTLLWKNVLASGLAWNVSITHNGKLAVATLSDGSIRWYRMSDGEEVLALFHHANLKDWVLWRPDGYYASSELGDNLIGWHVNRGRDGEPDFYRAVQFERQLYRPDLISNQIAELSAHSRKSLSVKTGAADNPKTRRGKFFQQPDFTTAWDTTADVFNIRQIDRIAPPRIRFEASSVNDDGEIEITVSAEKSSAPMQDVTIYANLLPVLSSAERKLRQGETRQFQRTFKFPANTTGDNLIRVEVNNGVSLGLAEQWVEDLKPADIETSKGNLYVLAVGVNGFDKISGADKNIIPDLSFADNDATKLAELLRKLEDNSGFNQVKVHLLADSAENKPSRQAIFDALKIFEQAEPNDTVMLFLASHGFSDKKGNYYFLPKDGVYSDIESVMSGRNLSGKSPSLLSWTDFIDSMRKASGRRIMIVDTCQAKNIFGEFDSRSLRKRSAAALFPLLLASKGDENSQEYEATQHGLFTHALLEGLQGQADSNRDAKITMTELNGFIVPLVNKLHNPSGGPQTPQVIAPDTLANIGLPVIKAP